MESIKIIFYEEPELVEPILIEGLPGVGNVGKLAAEHLLDQIDAVKFADIYSKHFPPQVMVNDEGVIKLVNNELYYSKGDGGRPDLILLIGDYQGLTPEGQYELSDHVLDIARQFGVKMIFTLGGYGIGKIVEEPRVLGAATDEELVEQMKEKGVVFSRGEPGSGIVGASGLLLGLGKVYGLKAVCLMGETSGYFVDPKGAEVVLRVLAEILNVEIDFSDLEDKAEQIDIITSKLKEIESPQEPKREDLGYIG
ncbi:MAG: proteasome assembly chaperone family protein [Methanomassiliicoccales archaeon]|nr:proteasome assembly chaperone family protein [Methanomassiliicoccales archaeon]NYT16075.1 proteasome assembly chaperone family protein [Methanomassiliicoccales archaeon]